MHSPKPKGDGVPSRKVPYSALVAAAAWVLVAAAPVGIASASTPSAVAPLTGEPGSPVTAPQEVTSFFDLPANQVTYAKLKAFLKASDLFFSTSEGLVTAEQKFSVFPSPISTTWVTFNRVTVLEANAGEDPYTLLMSPKGLWADVPKAQLDFTSSGRGTLPARNAYAVPASNELEWAQVSDKPTSCANNCVRNSALFESLEPRSMANVKRSENEDIVTYTVNFKTAGGSRSGVIVLSGAPNRGSYQTSVTTTQGVDFTDSQVIVANMVYLDQKELPEEILNGEPKADVTATLSQYRAAAAVTISLERLTMYFEDVFRVGLPTQRQLQSVAGKTLKWKDNAYTVAKRPVGGAWRITYSGLVDRGAPSTDSQPWLPFRTKTTYWVTPGSGFGDKPAKYESVGYSR